LFLPWAAFLATPYDIRIDLISASSVLLHAVIGRPLFLLPWGFYCSACLVMLFWGLRRMCPIQCHLRCFIVWTMEVWFVLLQSSVLVHVILSGHLMFKILASTFVDKGLEILFIFLCLFPCLGSI
jgi:hypothetical protein